MHFLFRPIPKIPSLIEVNTLLFAIRTSPGSSLCHEFLTYCQAIIVVVVVVNFYGYTTPLGYILVTSMVTLHHVSVKKDITTLHHLKLCKTAYIACIFSS